MAKYIIDIPDEAIDFMGGRDHFSMFVEPVFKTGDCKHYALRLSTEDIEPYTELDRKAIEDEVWEFAWEVLQLDLPVFRKIFGYDTDKMDYRDYKYKYEAWKKQKGELRVGDVVVHADDPNKEKMVVLRLYQPPQYKPIADVLCEDGTVVKTVVVKNLVWTGRHFSEVEELLKKMRGEE